MIPLDAVSGVSRVDASGRVAGPVIAGVLGWRAGDRLTLTAGSGMIVARRDPGGMVAVLARGAVAIPAALRHRCGLRAGDPVLLTALSTFGGGPGTIGLHGWPDPAVFGHAVSHGCVRVPAAALRALTRVPLGSPGMITG